MQHNGRDITVEIKAVEGAGPGPSPHLEAVGGRNHRADTVSSRAGVTRRRLVNDPGQGGPR